MSREAAAAGEEALQELLELRFEGVDLLAIYVDGMMVHHLLVRPEIGRLRRRQSLARQRSLQAAFCPASAPRTRVGRGCGGRSVRDRVLTFGQHLVHFYPLRPHRV